MNITNTVTVTDTVAETLSFGLFSATPQAQELPSFSLTNGTGSGQVDLHWEKVGVTLAASASNTYTLSALTDDLGRAVAFVRVKKIVIWVTSRAAADYLTVGNATTHDWVAIVGATGNTFKVRDLYIQVGTDATGLVVTSGTSDQLKILNSGAASVTYQISISGCSA